MFFFLFTLFVCGISIPLIHAYDYATSLTVDPLVLSGSMENVTLTWQGIEDPTSRDYIAIYSPPDNPAYIGYLMANDSATWYEGYGQLVVPLVNARANYSFGFFHFQGNVSELVAESQDVTFENLNEPLQGHLAATADPSVMNVMWVSNSNQTSYVQWWASSTTYSTTSAPLDSSSNVASVTTYTIDMMCDAPANMSMFFRNPGQIFSANMTNLSPGVPYSYRFGNDQDGWSQEFQFIGTPAVGPPSGQDVVKVYAFGDLGTNPPWRIDFNDVQQPAPQTVDNLYNQITRDLAANQSSMVLHIGDISYARGQAMIWELFHDLIQPVAAQVPWMVAIGNHEYDYYGQAWRPVWTNYGDDSGGECGVPYNFRFNMPGTNQTTHNFWYSYNYGPIHFVVISTEHDWTRTSPQFHWIEQDLASVDRTQTPWVIFTGHRPMYTTADHWSVEKMIQVMRNTYEPLLVKYQVDLCLWGHVHTNERFRPMLNNTIQPVGEAPIHIVIGMAGNTFQVPWEDLEDPQDPYHQNQPHESVFRAIDYGYTIITANATQLNYEFHGNHLDLVHDYFSLQKSTNGKTRLIE